LKFQFLNVFFVFFGFLLVTCIEKQYDTPSKKKKGANMGFDSGAMMFRVYEVDESLDSSSLIKDFAKSAAPSIRNLGRDAISGWVGPRHLLDTDLTEANCLLAGYVCATLMKAERKIPDALLRATCKIEEYTEMQRRGVAVLNRATRKEIKDRIVEELLPKMPPTLTGIPIVADAKLNRIYAQAMSESQQDAFVLGFRNTTKMMPVPHTPDVLAMKLKRIDSRNLDPVCFSPKFEEVLASEGLGPDFLTWLWFFSETENGLISPKLSGLPTSMGLLIEGPLLFYVEGEGAHEISLRKGVPTLGAEAKTALESGKKLRRAKMTLAHGNDQWSVMLDGMDFAFRSLKVPPGVPSDPLTKFQERMGYLETFLDVFYALYGHFLTLRSSRKDWDKTVTAMRTWIANRAAKV